MTRTTYYVSTHPEGGWQVKRESGERAIKRFSTQDQAIQYAREVAKNNMPSQVMVKGVDGKFRVEWTYGDDPYPPPG